MLVFATTFTEETIGYILSFNIFFLLLAIGFRILALILWGLRIVLMSRSLGYRVGLLYSLNMVLAGLLAGTITPGQAGGEPVRVHELFRAGVKIGDATDPSVSAIITFLANPKKKKKTPRLIFCQLR